MKTRHTPLETLAGTASVCAYLTGMLIGSISRHPAPIAVLALAITAYQRPRRSTASRRTTA
ncbi:hypothetical protein [Actinoplanes xinjiangensis]|uniref:hypothetical protein n=1 Tax=Actinoplanes xinjiangensis TaxID=512350 RepID=UPI00342E8D19